VLDEGAIERATGALVEAVERDEALPPAGISLLVARYASTGRPEIGGALAAALTRWLGHTESGHDADAPERLSALVDTFAISDDATVRDQAASLLKTLANEALRDRPIGRVMRGIEARLRWAAAPGRDDLTGTGAQALRDAIDELERIIGGSYQPGFGLTHQVSRDEPGTLDDQLSTASALVVAYATTGRLPYAMLAEELMLFARRTWWQNAHGLYRDDASAATPDAVVTVNCRAVRILSALAAVRDDPDYRQAAVLHESFDARLDAERILSGLDPGTSAEYAVALGEFLTLR
jgi:hypothetical protein